MVRFTSGRRSDFCETRSNFHHTLQGPYDDTVPGLEDFWHHMIFHGFLRLDPTCRRGTFAPQWYGSSSFRCTRPTHTAKTSYMIYKPLIDIISGGRRADLHFSTLKPYRCSKCLKYSRRSQKMPCPGTCHEMPPFESTRSFEVNEATGNTLPS